MLRTDTPDHRRSDERRLVAALRERDALALAEAYHRTAPAAHAVARRLLSGADEIEALLRTVYAELWTSPPDDAALEGWLRRRCFELAAEHLRDTGNSPASPSAARLLPELPTPSPRYLDSVERALDELAPEQRDVLLAAHDRGVPTTARERPNMAQALSAALLHLAGPEPGDRPQVDDACDDVPALADWVLGLVSGPNADEIVAAVDARPGCAARMRALRRGRRRLEGLPPAPDLGQRVLASVLASAPPTRPSVAEPVSALTSPPTHADPAEEVIPARRQRATEDDDALWGEVRAEDGGEGDSGAETSLRLSSVLGSSADDTEDLRAPEDWASAADEPEDGFFAGVDEEPPVRPGRGRRVVRGLLTWAMVLVGVLIGVYLGQLLFTAFR